MKIALRITSFLLLFTTLVFSQNSRVGTWKSHLPNKIATSVAAVGNIIYTGGPQTFFTYNQESNSINYNSKFKGYSGSSISKIGYSEETNTVVIAYDDSNIDLINGNTITKVTDILKSGIVGSRKVNHLYFYKEKAYFSTDYGLLIYNLRNQQVEDVCKMFKAGSNNTQVTSSTILNDTIYLTSNMGVFFAPVKDDVNKLDYRNWKEINTSDLDLDDNFKYIASVENRIYMANSVRVEIMENGNFIQDPLINEFVSSGQYQGIKNIHGKLLILQSNALIGYKSGVYTIISKNIKPVDVTIDKEDRIWVADSDRGLLKLVNTEVEIITTNGPFSNYAFQLYFYQNKMMILTGGYNFDFYGPIDGKIRPFGFSTLDNGIWNSYNFILRNAPVAFDICAAKYNPISNKLFFASHGNGMLEWNLNDNKFIALNQFTPGVPLRGSSTWNGDSASPSSNRVPDLAIDNKGVTWVLNVPDPNIGKASLFKYDLAGKWDSVKWEGLDQWGSYYYSPQSVEPYFLHKIFIDKNNNKWLASRYYSLVPNGQIGLFVYNENKSPLPRHLKYEKDKVSEICGKQVYCINQDLDGAIWIGTENGVCFFSDPEEIFLKKPVRATTPLLNNVPLLKGKRVTGIDFDGSNRKWISTSTDGLLLVSADGSKIISTFDESNSPLITKSVNDVKVNRLTGEVFVATDEGVFSYNGFSVDGTDHNESVNAYPNPLKRDYTGYFTVDGLVNKAIVKITDISGKLVFESKAEGSRFTWNVKDYNGNRPESGIYLIYSSKDDGSEHLLTKIAILD